jgi:S-disulfanyl-L-cysteine oxidoreductase SoxD
MSMRELLVAALVFTGGGALAAQSPNLGKPATPEEIAAWDIDVMPDGRFLPPGSGSAKRGAAIYEEKCQACHGPGGRGGMTLPLVGGEGTIGRQDVKPLRTAASYWPYATSIFAYMRRSMPLLDTKTLSNDELYALTAWILAANKIIGENDVMDAQTLAKVRMPWRDHFRPFQRGD